MTLPHINAIIECEKILSKSLNIQRGDEFEQTQRHEIAVTLIEIVTAHERAEYIEEMMSRI